jgi:hypothetical protein
MGALLQGCWRVVVLPDLRAIAGWSTQGAEAGRWYVLRRRWYAVRESFQVNRRHVVERLAAGARARTVNTSS